MNAQEANVDARRALGVRPGALPVPKINFGSSFTDGRLSPTAFGPPSPSQISPGSEEPPSFAYRQPVPSNARVPPSLPAISTTATSVEDVPLTPVIAASPEAPKRFRRPTLSHPKTSPQDAPPVNRGLYETQKLLSHLLDKLEARELAPDLLERASISARTLSGKSKGKGKRKVVQLGHAVLAAAHSSLKGADGAGPSSGLGLGVGLGSEDFEDRSTLEEGEWDTDATYDLVEQTRALLVLAHRQALDLFASTGISRDEGTTPIKSKRKAGRFSSITSPVSPAKTIFGDGSIPPQSHASSPLTMSGALLLERILETLRRLMQVECLHKTHSFRPLCPPNALQAACLDIASYLYHECGLDIQIKVVHMVIDGIYSMGEGMTERICEWVEGRMGELLGRLAKERGGPAKAAEEELRDPFGPGNEKPVIIPSFAIISEAESEGDNRPGWMRYSPSHPDPPFFPPLHEINGILSTHSLTSEFSRQALQISDLVTKLLVAITSTIDLTASKLSTIHRVHRLLSIALTARTDASLDLLAIAAHGPATARRTATELLATFFPQVMGHNMIARRLASTTYAAQRLKWETGQEKALGEDDAEGHHYIAWRIGTDLTSDGQARCGGCRKSIEGFAVRCTLCRDFRHLECYDSREHTFFYNVATVSSRHSTPQGITIKFSECLPRLGEQAVNGAASGNKLDATRRRVGQHELRLVNLFHLPLCGECYEPLWGTHAQAYACLNGCQRFFHSRCVGRLGVGDRAICKHGRELIMDEVSARGRNPFIISIESLQASFEAHLKPLCLNEEQLGEKSFDEVAILHGTLWTIDQLLQHGLSSGSIRIIKIGAAGSDSGSLGIQDVLDRYRQYLHDHSRQASAAAADFSHVAGSVIMAPDEYLFSERYLSYCAALLRAPSQSTVAISASDGLLSASGMPPSVQIVDDGSTEGAYEALDLSTIRRSLGSDLNLHDESICAIFLEQLKAVGLIISPGQFTDETVRVGSAWASFGLPFLMDSSPTVELLIIAIEAMLDDLDLTMNEQGLNLLVSRAWPTVLSSPYALERLGNAILRWVMAQDETLHHIVKTYASKHRRLPGVRSPPGTTAAEGTSSVALYKESRDQLLHRLVQPWLLALHDLDPILYAHLLYEQAKAPSGSSDESWQEKEDAREAGSRLAGQALERMTAAFDAGIVFTAWLDLLTAWLEDLGTLANQDIIYRSLPRLFRLSRPVEEDVEDRDEDIWGLAHQTAFEGSGGFDRVCRWMRVLAFSGVEIPWQSLLELVGLQATAWSSVEARFDLVTAVNANGAQIEADVFAHICAELFKNLVESIELAAGAVTLTQQEQDLVRHGLRLVLRAYGVDLEDMASSLLGSDELKTRQPASMSKRKRTTAGFPATLLELDEGVVRSTIVLLRHGHYPVGEMLDFLWLLFCKAQLVGNVDGKIHKLCPELYEVLWPLYDLPLDRHCRARVFLRLLAVFPDPVDVLVQCELSSGATSPVPERLLRFVLELADDSVTAENQGWRSAAVGLILSFLDILTRHTQPGSDSLVILKTLLPTHLRAMSACFEEALIQSSDERRLVLLGRLQKFQMVLPIWPVISWRIVDELVAEEVAAVNQLRTGQSSQAISALRDAQLVRSSLLALGLHMLASGITIPWATAQRFQQHVASLCALPWGHPIDGISNLVLPAMRSVLDSPTRIGIGNTMVAGKERKTMLVGSLFVPVVIDFGNELSRHDFLTQRCLLDILMVTFFKQNVLPVELAALGALQIVAIFAAQPNNAENRLLAISILHTATTRMDKGALRRAMPSMFAIMADVVIKETREDGDSAIIDQTRALLREIIKTFGKSGLFLQVMKNEGTAEDASKTISTGVAMSQGRHESTADSSFGQVLDLLWLADSTSDTEMRQRTISLIFGELPEILKRDRQSVEQVLVALRSFTACLQIDISDGAAQAFGAFVSRLAKHVAEWEAADFDTNHMLRSCASLLAVTSATASVTLLHQVSTLLHLCLSRFAVEQDSIDALLGSSEAIANKLKTENTVRTVLFELAGSALHGLAVMPTSLCTLLAFVASNAVSTSNDGESGSKVVPILAESSPGCVTILLRTHPTCALSTGPESILAILHHAAMVLIRAEVLQAGTLASALSSLPSEAAAMQLGVFVQLLLASQGIPMAIARDRLMDLYPILARTMSLCLRASADLLGVQDPAGGGAELLSQVYVVFRLAVLASKDAITSNKTNGREALMTLWRRIWPDWFRLIALSLNGECVNMPLRAVSHSVFLDLVIFLSAVDSSLLSSEAEALSHASQLLVQYVESNGQAGGKIIKAVAALEGGRLRAGTNEGNSIIAAIRADILATERLRALRAMQ